MAPGFIAFLTEPGELVLDPFADSNTTGAVAERLGRRWISLERDAQYAAGSELRFADNDHSESNGRSASKSKRQQALFDVAR